MADTAAFIFVRGGSKGLPRKNILPIAGMPLLAHSINLAKQLDDVQSVYVSTDCPEISEIAKAYGAEVIKRPDYLATDTSPEWLSWQHAIGYVQEHSGPFECFLSLPATSPLRHVEDVERCLAALRSDVDLVMAIVEASRSPWFNMVTSDSEGLIKLVACDGAVHRRQDAPECFDLTTVAYVARPEFILCSSSIWQGNVVGVKVPRERAIDIDTPLDFAIACFLMEQWMPEHG